MAETKGHIRVKPYLAAYVRWRENLAPQQPLIVPGCSPIAIALDLCLTNKTTYLAARPSSASAKQPEEKLPYLVTGSRSQNGFVFITEAMSARFNSFLHHSLHNDLADRIFRELGAGVEAESALRGRVKQTILRFMAEAGIDPLVDYDAIAKANYRLRTSRGFAHQRGRDWTYSPTAMRFIRPDREIGTLHIPEAYQLRLAL